MNLSCFFLPIYIVQKHIVYAIFHWKCPPPKICHYWNLRFLSTNSNSIDISIWMNTTRSREIWVFGFAGYLFSWGLGLSWGLVLSSICVAYTLYIYKYILTAYCRWKQRCLHTQRVSQTLAHSSVYTFMYSTYTYIYKHTLYIYKCILIQPIAFGVLFLNLKTQSIILFS